MLDIKFIRENPEKVKEACRKKNVKCDVDGFLKLDEEKRGLLSALENLRAKQNKLGRPACRQAGDNIEEGKKIKEEIKAIEPKFKETESKLTDLLLAFPNIPFDDAPVGVDDSQNVILRKVGQPSLKLRLGEAKNYMELGSELDLIDTERAGKVAGTRFGYLKNEAVLIEFALVKMVFDLLLKRGFIPVSPPVMLKDEMARGTGYFEAGDKDEAYFLPQDNLFLVGTAEQSLIAMHADEILTDKELPKRYVAFSTCFRREAGSYGKDNKGIFRVHQFDKIEMVIFSKPEDSKKEHELLLDIEEQLMKSLKLPYQVVNICTGDLGRPAAKKYDIETWIPSENKYRETHSTSNCADFQARRLNIRYRDKEGKLNFVHTLNGTAIAIPRTLIAILENYQQKDGSIKTPKVLQKYIGRRAIKKGK